MAPQIGTMEYSPHGSISSSGGIDFAHGFTGLVFDDASGLVYTPYRYYAPGQSRWMSREPTGADGTNLYMYALANPVSAVDRTGLSSTFWSDTGDTTLAFLDGVIPWFDPFEDYYRDPSGCIHRAQRLAKFAGSTTRNIALALMATGWGMALLKASGQTGTVLEAFAIGKGSAGVLVEKMYPMLLPLYRGGGGLLAIDGVIEYWGEATGLGGSECR